MNRRGFLGIMLAACAAPAVVKSGSIMRIKPILLPGIDFSFTSEDLTLSVEEFQNRFLTPSIIAREALFILEKNLIMANSVNRKFEQQFLQIGDRLGDRLTIRRPHESN